MRRGALRYLLARPLVIVLAAFAVPVIIVAVVAIGAERPSAGLLLPSLIAAAVGILCGGSIRDAARCPFAWTLPGYWRSVVSGFALAGTITAVLLSGLVVLSGAAAPAWLVAAAAFTAFVLAGTFAMGPQAFVALTVFVLWAGSDFRSGDMAAAAALAAPVPTVAVLTVCSVITLALLANARVFRSCAHSEPVGPGRESWRGWFKVFRQPGKRRVTGDAAHIGPPSQTSASVGWTVFTELRADRVRLLLTAAAVGLIAVLAFGPATIATVRYKPVPGLWVAWFVIIMAPRTSRLASNRLSLPLSRQQHCRVAYVLSACEVLLVAVPSGIGLASSLAAASPDVREAVCRGLAAIVCWYPAIQWARTRPSGNQWPDPVLRVLAGIGAVTGFVAVINLAVSVLPVIVPSGVGQVAVLALFLGASQALHWGALSRFFTEADLVSNSST
jgi:hypothetical protein